MIKLNIHFIKSCSSNFKFLREFFCVFHSLMLSQITSTHWIKILLQVQPTLLKSIRFCFIDVRWLLTAFDFQILKTTTCTLSYKTLKILSTFCSLVWKIRENLKILFSKIWPDRTDSCNIMCIWVKSPGEFKNLDLSKVNEHRTSSSLLESLKLSCILVLTSHVIFPAKSF